MIHTSHFITSKVKWYGCVSLLVKLNMIIWLRWYISCLHFQSSCFFSINDTCWYFEILQITCFTAVFIQWFCIHWWSLPESIILLKFSNELFFKLCQSFFFLLFLLPSFPHHPLSLKYYTSIHFYFYFFLWFYLGSPSI